VKNICRLRERQLVTGGFSFDDEFETFVAYLKEEHSNRPTLLDEMEALETADV